MAVSGSFLQSDSENGAAPIALWVLCDNKIGTLHQARGLVERLEPLLPTPPKSTEILATARPPFRWLPARFWGCFGPSLAVHGLAVPLLSPWPDLLIAAGRCAVAPAAAIRRVSHGKTKVVALQNPRLPLDAFDLVIAPAHDGLSGVNVLTLEGTPNRISAARLQEGARACPSDLAEFYRAAAAVGAPVAAILLGGKSSRYRFDDRTARQLARQLAELAQGGVMLALTPSRRTPETVITILKQALSAYQTYWWNGMPPNPYLALLALSDHLLVTADSVSMVSEAASSGKPVHRIDLPGHPGKLAYFHSRLETLGVVRTFDGTLPCFTPPPFDETARAALAVVSLLRSCDKIAGKR